MPIGSGTYLLGVIFDRVSRFCPPSDVRFTPQATDAGARAPRAFPAPSFAPRGRFIARRLRERLALRRRALARVGFRLRPAGRKRRVGQQQLPDAFYIGAGFAGTARHDATMATSVAPRQGRARRSHMLECTTGAGRAVAPSRPRFCAPRPEISQDDAVKQQGAGQDPHPILHRQTEKVAVAEEPMHYGAGLSWCNDELAC